jgi:hypothetical protein
LPNLAASIKALGAQTFFATSRSELPAALKAALGDLAEVQLQDVEGDAEGQFYVVYTKTEERAKRLQDEIGRRFPTLPRTPLIMKLAALLYNETGQIPSSLGGLFEQYVAELVSRARSDRADPDGLLFAIRQLTIGTFLAKQGARRGFPEERGIEVLGRVAKGLKNRDVTASPIEILRALARAGIYIRRRNYYTAPHDLLEDYFAALVLDRDWDEDPNGVAITNCRNNPKLDQAWRFLVEIRPEANSPPNTVAT